MAILVAGDAAVPACLASRTDLAATALSGDCNAGIGGRTDCQKHRKYEHFHRHPSPFSGGCAGLPGASSRDATRLEQRRTDPVLAACRTCFRICAAYSSHTHHTICRGRLAACREMSSTDPQDLLTPKQLTCVRHASKGGSKRIASILGISPNTVDNHLKAAMQRLGTHTRDAHWSSQHATPMATDFFSM